MLKVVYRFYTINRKLSENEKDNKRFGAYHTQDSSHLHRLYVRFWFGLLNNPLFVECWPYVTKVRIVGWGAPYGFL